MACQFDIPLTSSPDELATKAKAMVESAGGSFNGDGSAGEITIKLPVGSVQGQYTVGEGKVSFTINKKPMMVPCSTIQSFVEARLK